MPSWDEEFSIFGPPKPEAAAAGPGTHVQDDDDATSFASAEDGEESHVQEPVAGSSCVVEEVHEEQCQNLPSTSQPDHAGSSTGSQSHAHTPEAAAGSGSQSHDGPGIPAAGPGSSSGEARDPAAAGSQAAEAGSEQAAQGQAGTATESAAAAGAEGAGGTEAAEVSPEPELSPEEQKQLLEKSEGLKAEGNTLYAQGQYEEAAAKYLDAFEEAPEGSFAARNRAVYAANLAACKLGEKKWSDAVDAATTALEEDPAYVKALMRRAAALQELDHLDQALADAKKVLELDAGSTWARATIARLEPVVRERQEKLKDEMLGKLKDLGNTILGKFGMSVDNFKAVKDPATGSYSISFQQ